MCQSFLGIDASQLHNYSMCQPMPIGILRVRISIQKPLDSNFGKTRHVALRKWSCPIFNEEDLSVNSRAYIQQANRKKLSAFMLMDFFSHRNTVFGTIGCFYHFHHCYEVRPSLTEEGFQCGSKKRELGALRRHQKQEKGFIGIEMLECQWWRLYKTTNFVKHYTHENFTNKCSLTENQLLEEIKRGKTFGYVQCDIDAPENLRSRFANFPPILKTP